MMFDSCVERAAQLNDEAITLLAYGAPGPAFQTFKTALGILYGATTTSEELTRNNCHTSKSTAGGGVKSAPSSLMTAQGTRAAFSPPSELAIDSIAIPNFEMKKSGSFVYNRVISFHYPSHCAASMNIAFYCGIVMFNMALTMQLMNDRCPKDSALDKALRLYDLTMSLLDETSNSSPSMFSFECLNLRIATLNNKAQIFYDLCRFEEAHKALDSLMTAFVSTDDISSIFEPQEIEGFLLNVMLLSAHPVAPAA